MVQAIVPDPVFSAHLVTALAVMVTSLLIYRFCASYFERPDAGLLAALLYLLCTSRWVALSTNPLIFNNALTAFATISLLSSMREKQINHAKAIMAALALGIGLQFKYVIFPEAVLLCLGFLIESHLRDRNILKTIFVAGALLSAGLLPTATAVFYFWMNGALTPFVTANINSNVDYLDITPGLPILLRGIMSGLAPVFGCCLLTALAFARFVRLRSRWQRVTLPAWWLALWLVAAAIDVCLPLKFFVYYFFALYAPLCIAGAVSLSFLAERSKGWLIAGAVAIFVTAVPIWFVSAVRVVHGNETDGPRTAARYIRNHAGKNSNVFVYDYNPVVYALARTSPPTPYVLGSELAEYNNSSHVNGETEIQRVMDTSPDFVVLRHRKPGETTPSHLDGPLLQRLANYRICYQEADVDDAIITIYAR